MISRYGTSLAWLRPHRPGRGARIGALFARGAVAGALIVAACQERSDGGRVATTAKRDDGSQAVNAGRDPCDLVTRQEAEVYLGPLAHDPYRSGTDLKGDADGGSCVYRAPGGQSIVVTPNWRDGKMMMKLNHLGQSMAAVVLADESGKADTLGGEWDDIMWTGPADLLVLKDDVSIDVDVSGSKAGIAGAAKLADAAFPRVTTPLAYDGAKPAADAPGPLVSAREPCAVFPRKDVEEVLGPLTGDPVNDDNLHTCVFNLPRNPTYLARVSVEAQWSGGFKRMSQELWAAHAAMGGFTAKINPGGTDAIRRDTGVQTHIAKVEAANGGKVNQDAIFLKTDTTSQPPGPWDEAAVVVGGEFVAVKKDVYMSVDLRLFPIERARRLITIGMTHF